MAYFVTGASGFIGRRLVKKLLARKGKIYVLMRAETLARMSELYGFWQTDRRRVIPVVGDLQHERLGISEADLNAMSGKIRHLYHLAAIYDLKAGAEIQQEVNVEGTRNAVALAETLRVGCFHLVSSIAAAGLYEGVFREDMFAEAENLEHPYYRSKHDSEAWVRRECTRPWRVYRPGIVVGDSQTGEMDKIDGPYYFFKLIQRLRNTLPPWMPMVGLEGGRLNLVPVDFVVAAMDYISHRRGLDGRCFHLVDPKPHRVGEILNIFARAGHAPPMTMRLNARLFAFVPQVIQQGLAMLPPVRRIAEEFMASFELPPHVMDFINYPTRFDCRETLAVLKGTGITVPRLEDYAWCLWDYWERHLDPDLFSDRTLSGKVKDNVVIVTGSSSGIGKATALRLAAAGAKVILVARHEDKLRQTRREIEAAGGSCALYTADLADLAACDRLIERVLEDHGRIDILINNAGRSIRRAIANSFDRFHDYERCMQLNYFGAIRLIMGVLPGMVQRRKGHIINISSIGVLANAPRFSAYVASKAALDAFARCAAAEFSDVNVKFTNINMPLVKTPMIAPTTLYRSVPTLTPEEAAELVAEAIIHQPERVATRLGIAATLIHALSPKLWEIIMNTAFRLFPESAAARGQQEDREGVPSPEMISFAQLTRGIHW